jgi:hypothetical protein
MAAGKGRPSGGRGFIRFMRFMRFMRFIEVYQVYGVGTGIPTV